MFGTYMEGLRQAEDLMEKGEHEEALHQINLLEKGVELGEVEKLACMLLTSQIMNKVGHYDKSLMLSKVAFRKSMELSEPLLVVDSTITFLESISGLGMLFDASQKDHKEFMTMIETSEEILKTIDKLKKNEREIRSENLTNLKGIIKHAQAKVVPVQKEEPKKELVAIPVDKIKGVGQKAAAMIEAGFKTAADVAYASIDDLVKIKGIGQASAVKLIESAKELLK
jgi:transcription termination factor NusA